MKFFKSLFRKEKNLKGLKKLNFTEVNQYLKALEESGLTFEEINIIIKISERIIADYKKAQIVAQISKTLMEGATPDDKNYEKMQKEYEKAMTAWEIHALEMETLKTGIMKLKKVIS